MLHFFFRIQKGSKKFIDLNFFFVQKKLQFIKKNLKFFAHYFIKLTFKRFFVDILIIMCQ